MKIKNLHNLFTLSEVFTTEFKYFDPSNLGREICVFANANGGVISTKSMHIEVAA